MFDKILKVLQSLTLIIPLVKGIKTIFDSTEEKKDKK